jgi:hypothetical protein
VDDVAARTLALARSALARATDAERAALEAKEGHRTTYEALGGQLHEIARINAGLREVSEKLEAVERLMREGFQKLATGAVQAKRAAMKSGHDLATLRDDVEDSKVTHLREELLAAKAKYESLRVRDKSIRGWVWKVIAGVLVGVLVAWLSTLRK